MSNRYQQVTGIKDDHISSDLLAWSAQPHGVVQLLSRSMLQATKGPFLDVWFDHDRLGVLVVAVLPDEPPSRQLYRYSKFAA